MDELDKKLKQQLDDAYNRGHKHCTEDYCDNFLYDSELDSYSKVIKQAFKDAGWLEPGIPTINNIPLNTPEGRAEERKYYDAIKYSQAHEEVRKQQQAYDYYDRQLKQSTRVAGRK